MSLCLHYLYLDRVIAPKQTHKIWVRELTKIIYPHARRGGLMVSDLVSGSGGLGSSPVRDIVLSSWTRHLTVTVLLSTQVYKLVLVNLTLGGNPAMD